MRVKCELHPMAKFTQANRRIAVQIASVGTDVLLLTAFNGREHLSELFSYNLEMLSSEDFIDAKKVVGMPVSWTVKRADDKTLRPFHGIVKTFSAGSRESGLRRYYAEVVPWFWYLTRTSDCRIFQEQTVPEIVRLILSEAGFKDFEDSEVKGKHVKWEYCVQYRETDFNFISRLLEQEGIFYYFRHEAGRHVLVMGDQNGAHKDMPEKDVEMEYSRGLEARPDRLLSWEHRFDYIPGKWTHTDYNFIQHPAGTAKTPAKHILGSSGSLISLEKNANLEMFDFPSEEYTADEAKAQARVRMEADEASYETIAAGGTCKTFTCGGKFKLIKHEIKALEGRSFVVSAIQHSATEPASYDSTATAASDYKNTFTCIPATITYRPPQVTPKPMIHGSQTAVVTGPPGEEIWPDKHGRIKVQFYWDRLGVRNDKSSCWIRVQQSSAGKGWGAMFIPRIGQEVVVSYLEGDPDRPLITGVVYNGEQTPAYPLPEEKTKSYIKTNSSKGGNGYNEIRFEDKADKEQIFMHAQKDIDVRVLNNSKERIFGNRDQVIGWEKDGKKGGDQREKVYGNKQQHIIGSQAGHVEGDMQLMIKGDKGGNQDIVIDKNKAELIGADSDLHIKGGRQTKVDGTDSLVVGGSLHEKIGQVHAIEAGMEVHIKAGMKVIIESGVQLSLKGPGGFIDIGPAGVAIQGTMVLINSGGAAGAGSGCKPKEAKDAKEAKPAEAQIADNSKTGNKSAPDSLS